jgi:hypothetical protein
MTALIFGGTSQEELPERYKPTWGTPLHDQNLKQMCRIHPITLALSLYRGREMHIEYCLRNKLKNSPQYFAVF